MGFLNNPWNVLILGCVSLVALWMILHFIKDGGKIKAGKDGIEIDDDTPEVKK